MLPRAGVEGGAIGVIELFYIQIIAMATQIYKCGNSQNCTTVQKHFTDDKFKNKTRVFLVIKQT